MTIVNKNGARYEAQVDYPKGSLEHPMTDDEHREKFLSLASPVLSKNKIAQIIAMVDKFEEIDDVSRLCSLIH